MARNLLCVTNNPQKVLPTSSGHGKVVNKSGDNSQLVDMTGLHRDQLHAFTYSVLRKSFNKFIKLWLVHNFQLALLGTHCENRLENKDTQDG